MLVRPIILVGGIFWSDYTESQKSNSNNGLARIASKKGLEAEEVYVGLGLFLKKRNEEVLHFLLYNLPHRLSVVASFSPYFLDGS